MIEHRKALVINNADPDKQGKIQARVLPEFNGVDASLLKWIYPFLLEGGGGPNSTHKVPEINEYVTVVIKDKFWLNIEYLPSDYIIDSYPYSDFESIASNIVELGAQSYPQPNYVKKFKDGTFIFHNTDTGESGIYNNNGSYWLFDANGDLIFNTVNKKIAVKNNLANIYKILIDVKELLERVVTPSNWLGNLAKPVQYLPFVTDQLKLQQIKIDIDNLFKSS